jgi:4-amino-4-deoxy-L-arabinose transferase-like glycosyltransferase
MKKVILIILIVIAFFLRTYNLNVSPPGFNADEAALGYNAYSLLKTGKDEWGQSFPLVFKSFSDYKPGLYVYLDIPFIFLFGLNELAVRLPSIILGTLSCLLIYFLSKEITKKDSFALTTTFLLAVSPWHIHYSRGAWETNVATFFILAGILTFIMALKKPLYYYLSLPAFIAAMYTYQSPRLLVPILGLFLIIFYWKDIFFNSSSIKLKNLNRSLGGAIVISAIILIPLVFIVSSNQALARFQGVSIFTDVGTEVKLNQERGEDGDNSLEAKLFHNKLTAYGLNFLSHYLDHFRPDFLFISGDPLGRNKVPGMGELYIFEIITLVLGLIYLIDKKPKNTKVIFIWLFVAPIASALTYQTPHALRAENMVIPLTFISGTGLGYLLEYISSLRKIKYPLYGLTGLILVFFILRFLHQYMVHLPQQYALEWENGFSQLVPYLESQKGSYQKILVTDKYDQPYILFLFYSKYDPATYQKEARSTGIDKFGFSTVRNYGKYEFRSIGQEEISKEAGTLYVGIPLEIDPASHTPQKIINYPNGTPAFIIVGKTNEK